MARENNKSREDKLNILGILKPYRGIIGVLILLTLLGNGANLIIPKIISRGIDSFTDGNYILRTIVIEFLVIAMVIFFFSYLQSIVQTFTSEKVARDLRKKLSEKISKQSYAYVLKANPSKLLTNLTSDMDSVKMFVAQAISTIASSLILIIGICILLLNINWKLALTVIAIIPVIAITFYIILKKVRVLFKKSQDYQRARDAFSRKRF